MADKSTRLILDALTRAAAEPAGMPLHAAKGTPGLFPATAAARSAAKRCRDDGLIETHPANGKREVAAITPRGLDWLLTRTSPREVLEDFLRVLEQKQARAVELIDAARHIAAGLDALRGAVERLAPAPQAHHLAPAGDAERDIPILLDQWHAAAPGDCPLPELYRRLTPSHPNLTVGRFHDALRRLHDRQNVYLHPWTGPLYELPEPPFALLVGHEIAYYVSPRTPLAA